MLMLSRYNPIYLWWRDLHKPTIYSVLFLLGVGLLAVFSASYHIGSVLNVSDLYFFNKQIAFVLVAFVIFFIISFQNTEAVIKLSQLGFICCIFAMIATFGMSGRSVKGAERWLDLKVITIQPSELLKPFFIVISAYIYFLFERTRNIFYPILHGFLYCIIAFLLFLQPDFGMILTYTFLTGVLILLSSIRIKFILYLSIPVFIAILIAIFSLSHVRTRILHFVKGEKMYQTQIAYDAIKHGGLFGNGVGAGEISKRLPDSHNDFIFARIGEELGSLFLIIIICVFAVLLFSNIAYAKKEQDFYSELAFNSDPSLEKYQMSIIVNNYIIFLTVALIFFEVFVNMSVNLSLIPPKGMALPFISYGGSSMFAHAFLISFLCVANRRKYRFIPIYQSRV
jgi:cell division protein FtsW